MNFRRKYNELKEKVIHINEEDFEKLALEIFNFQARHNKVYSEYIRMLGIESADISRLNDIPFLPISFFKTQKVICGEIEPEVVFRSSGTTNLRRSRHFVTDSDLYIQNCIRCWEEQFDDVSEFCYLATLPSYEERSDASLIFMVKTFMEKSKYSDHCGFFLNDYNALENRIHELRKKGIPVVLFGVTFSLLDLAERGMDCSSITVIETGGMKGRKKEMQRDELYRILQKGLNVNTIFSEYGMTELLSQAYSKEKLIYEMSKTMKILPRKITDPLSRGEFRKRSAFNIIDLANLGSCSFIAADDIGRIYENDTFRILGRLDYSDLRGCQLMIE